MSTGNCYEAHSFHPPLLTPFSVRSEMSDWSFGIWDCTYSSWELALLPVALRNAVICGEGHAPWMKRVLVQHWLWVVDCAWVSQSNSEVQYYETDFSANISCFLVSDLYIIVGDILVLHQTILLLQKGHNPHSIIHYSTFMWIHFQVEWSALVWHSWPLSPLTTCRSEATYIIDTFGGGNWACLCLFLHFRMFPTILLGHIMNLMVKALLLQEKPAALRLQFILCVFILGLP